MKYDPSNWQSFKASKTFAPGYVETEIRLSSESKLECISPDGEITLVGYGSEFRLTLPSDKYSFKAGADGVYYRRIPATVDAQGEVLVTFDKKRSFSPVQTLIKQQFREMELRKLSDERERRKADQEHIQSRINKGLQKSMPDELVDPPEPPPPPEPIKTSPDAEEEQTAAS